MSPAKVTLSTKELEMVNDTGWILTKNAIIGKVYTLFGSLSEKYRAELEKEHGVFDEVAAFRSPKISKGEQYEGLPWVMLDQPRYFTGEDTFAIRSFFWWGNFCSISLQLSGRFHQKHRMGIQHYFEGNGFDSKQCRDWVICLNEDPWQHHLRSQHCLPVTEWSERSFVSLPFIKLTKKISLNNWDGLENFFCRNYAEILEMLTTY